MTNGALENPNNETPLESWKEIAAYLQRDVSTAMRWEKCEGLPVRRHHHQARSSVYAYPSELEAWRANRKPSAEAPHSPWWRLAPAFASTIVVALALMTVGSGAHIGALVQAADGSGIVTRQVWTGPGADANGTPSPDGRYLSFTDWSTGDLAIRDLTTGQNRRLTKKEGGWENWHEYAQSSVISPDGKQVAFEWSNRQDYCELRLIGLDGSQPRLLYRTERPNDVIAPADWSQDGKYILALLRTGSSSSAVSRIVRVSVADGAVEILKTLDWRFPDEMRFSPDGRYVLYDFPAEGGDNSDIWMLVVGDGQVNRLVEHPAQDFLLGWAPDGKSVLFASDRTGNWSAWLVPVAGGKRVGEPKLVRRDMGRIRPLGFTRQGAFYYGVDDKGFNIYAATLGGETPSLLVQRFLGSNSGPAWSPDGRQLAYLSHRSPPPRTTTLCVREVATGKEREFAPDFVFFKYLEWSPDGRFLLFRGKSLKGETGSYRLDLGTGQVAPVLQRPYGSWAVICRWSYDGKAVYYVEPAAEQMKRPPRVMRRDLETGGEEEIQRLPKGATFGFVLPSPDGRRLALWIIIRGGEEFSLAVMPAGGGDIKELLAPALEVKGLSLTWTPDSRQILFIKQVGKLAAATRSELWSVPVDGGEPRNLGVSMMRRIESLSIHPDGRRLALHVYDPTTEVWVMEDFLPETAAGGPK